ALVACRKSGSDGHGLDGRAACEAGPEARATGDSGDIRRAGDVADRSARGQNRQLRPRVIDRWRDLASPADIVSVDRRAAYRVGRASSGVPWSVGKADSGRDPIRGNRGPGPQAVA